MLKLHLRYLLFDAASDNRNTLPLCTVCPRCFPHHPLNFDYVCVPQKQTVYKAFAVSTEGSYSHADTLLAELAEG